MRFADDQIAPITAISTGTPFVGAKLERPFRTLSRIFSRDQIRCAVDDKRRPTAVAALRLGSQSASLWLRAVRAPISFCSMGFGIILSHS